MFNVRKIKSFFFLIFKIHKSINDNNWAAVLVRQQRQQVKQNILSIQILAIQTLIPKLIV